MSYVQVLSEGCKSYFGISGYVFLEIGIWGLNSLNYGILGSENHRDLGFDVCVNGILGYHLKISGIMGCRFCPSLSHLIFGINDDFGISGSVDFNFGISESRHPLGPPLP